MHFARRPPDGAPQNPRQNSGLLELTAEFLLTHTQYPLGRVSTELLRDSVYNSVSATLPCLLRCSATSKVFFLSCWLQSVPQHVSVWLLTSSEVPPLCTGIQSLTTLSHPHGMNPQRPLTPEIKPTPCKYMITIHDCSRKWTHTYRHAYNDRKCRKNCSVLIMANACIFYKVFPSSLHLYMHSIYMYLSPLKMRSLYLFYLRCS